MYIPCSSSSTVSNPANEQVKGQQSGVLTVHIGFLKCRCLLVGPMSEPAVQVTGNRAWDASSAYFFAACRNELGEHACGTVVEGGPLSCLRRTPRHQFCDYHYPFGRGRCIKGGDKGNGEIASMSCSWSPSNRWRCTELVSAWPTMRNGAQRSLYVTLLGGHAREHECGEVGSRKDGEDIYCSVQK